MVCVTSCCGTGLFDVPKAADVNTSIGFLGIARYGAIDLSWNHPSVLPGGESEVTVYYSHQTYFMAATVLGKTTNSYMTFDATGERANKVWYFWLEDFVIGGEKQGVLGPIAVEAKASSVADAINDLSEELKQSNANIALRGQIDSLVSDVTQLGVSTTDLYNEALGISGTLNTNLNRVDDQMTYLASQYQSIINETQSVATKIDEIGAEFGDIGGIIQAQSQVIADIETGLSMSYTVKMQGTNSDGKPVAGGLAFTYGENTDTVDFGIMANRFFLTSASTDGNTIGSQTVFPFMVSDDTVYMNTAVIKDASIGTGKIEELRADKIKNIAGNQTIFEEVPDAVTGEMKTVLKADAMVSQSLVSKNYSLTNKTGVSIDLETGVFNIFGKTSATDTGGYLQITNNGIYIYSSKTATTPTIELTV